MRIALPSGATLTTSSTIRRDGRAGRVLVSAALACGLLAAGMPAAHAAGPVPTVVATTTAATSVADAFGRTVSVGWGTADQGGAWTVANNAAVSHSVASGSARQRITTPGHSAWAHLNGVSTHDTDLRVNVAFDKIANGGGTYVSVVGRRVGTTGDYRARVKIQSSGAVALVAARGETPLATANVPGLTATAGTKLSVRLQVTGTAPTSIRAKVWKAGAAEPTSWQVSAVDSTAALQTRGALTLSTYVSGSSTNAPVTAQFSGLSVRPTTLLAQPTANALPTASVARSVSGLTASLDGSASADRDGSIASYAWSFGDGTTASGRTVQHRYAKAGTYSVRLVVTDNAGATASATSTVTVKAPVAAGAAGPDTTGVPAGTALTVHHGDLTVTAPGAVIDRMDIRGLVRIKAPGVVIKRSIVRGKPLTGSMGLITNDLGAYSFTLEDSELIASQASPWVNGIIGHNFTVRRTEIANVIDSVHITGSNVTVEDSWLHGNLFYASDPNQKGGPSHADSIQIQAGTNLKFLRNRIDGAYSSAIQTTQDRGVVTGVLVEGNRIGGGGCSINIAWGSKYAPITGFTVKDNTFGTDTRHNRCAIIGPSPTAAVLSANTFADGSAVSISRGW